MAEFNYHQDVISHKSPGTKEVPYLTPAQDRYGLRFRNFVPLRGIIEYCTMTRDVSIMDRDLQERWKNNLLKLVGLNTPFLPFLRMSSANA